MMYDCTGIHFPFMQKPGPLRKEVHCQIKDSLVIVAEIKLTEIQQHGGLSMGALGACTMPVQQQSSEHGQRSHAHDMYL